MTNDSVNTIEVEGLLVSAQESATLVAGLITRLPEQLSQHLARAAALAEGQGASLWLVGGIVRDLLLGIGPGRDVDLAVEGDALALATTLAAGGGRIIAAHAPFGTATIELATAGGPLVVDLARTRVETYAHPAALPEVTPASIEADLIRRDFSINALALELRQSDGVLLPGRLLDRFGGRSDLAAGVLRLLHPASLRDDPTRILRGLRLAGRLDMAPEPATAAQIAAALDSGYLARLTPERILHELCLALDERRPDAALLLADRWGVTPQILPGVGWSEQLRARSERIVVGHGPPATRLVWAGILLYDIDDRSLASLLERYPLPTEAIELVKQVHAAGAVGPQLAGPLPNSLVERLLRPFSAEAVAVLHYAEPAAAPATERYLSTLRAARAPLNGNDLRLLGVAPGPVMGRLLEELRAATLDDQVRDRASAEAWVRKRLGQG